MELSYFVVENDADVCQRQ